MAGIAFVKIAEIKKLERLKNYDRSKTKMYLFKMQENYVRN